MKIIDVNAAFGFWPIQRIPDRSLAALEQRYSSLGISEVWLSAIESILYPEPDTYDQALFGQLAEYPRFRAVKTVNPLLANWRTRLDAAHSSTPLAAIKLFPSYHGYTLDEPVAEEVAAAAAAMNLPVLIQMRVNDERNQPVAMQVHGVKASAIAAFSQKCERAVIIALSAYTGELEQLAEGSERLFADLSFLDGSDAIGWASSVFPPERLLFGSLSSWVYPEAALLKLNHPHVADALRKGIVSGHLLTALECARHNS